MGVGIFSWVGVFSGVSVFSRDYGKSKASSLTAHLPAKLDQLEGPD